MGSDIFQGTKGVFRIVILVLLVISLILNAFLTFYGGTGIEGYWGFAIFVLICLIIWYILLAVDAFPYDNTVRLIDGISHVVLGVLVIILGAAALISLLVNTKFTCDLTECWLYYIGQVVYIVAGVIMIILGVKVIKKE